MLEVPIKNLEVENTKYIQDIQVYTKIMQIIAKRTTAVGNLRAQLKLNTNHTLLVVMVFTTVNKQVLSTACKTEFCGNKWTP